jgi:hypothetical protein
MKKIILFILLFTFNQGVIYAQKFSIQSVQFGYRIYEMNPVGNNPYTIPELLKDPEAYQEMISQYEVDGFNGGAGIQVPKQYYINVELGNKDSKFWSKHSLQAGFFVGSQLFKRMSLTNTDVNHADSSYVTEYYYFTQNQRFVGLNLGLRRRITLSKNFNFMIGLEAEGRATVQHNYTQQKESIFLSNTDSEITYQNLPSFKGKMITQGHVMLPFGFEFVHKSISLRAEGFIGILDDKYRSSIMMKEGHGLSFWIGYRF